MPRKAAKRGNVTEMQDLDYPVPTQREFEKMARYGAFKVQDDQGNEFRFGPGDTATILPNGKPPGSKILENEYWVGDILEVRGLEYPDGSNDVWAKVRWWYAPQEVHGAVRSFDPTKCSQFERIYSEQTDRVCSEAFNEVVKVHKLRDDDLNQPYIAPDDFHTRYEMSKNGKRVDPEPGASSCTCSVPYAYHDGTTAMHFCPRPSCRKWYHESCLIDANSLYDTPHSKPTTGLNKAKRGRPSAVQENQSQTISPLHTSPDTDSILSSTNAARASTQAAKRRRTSLRSHASISSEKSPRKSKVTLEDPIDSPTARGGAEEDDILAALEKLPAKLVLVASQPIVRGSLYSAGGISGNVRAVVRARRLVYEILGLADEDCSNVNAEHEDLVAGVEREKVPHDWEQRVFGEDLESRVKLDDCVVKLKGRKGVQVLACPECKSAI
ncbi:hypothetical protein NMY22_g16826 [Coprinellus aureogranulatus]|nr:hypothetical protein NMY22_g16826 [Coprinellus aureogranulatus]